MSDEADDAFDTQMALEHAAIENARALASVPLPTSRKCLECDSDTLNGARWCDATCRDIWELRK